MVETSPRPKEATEGTDTSRHACARRLLRLGALTSTLVFTCLVLYAFALTSSSGHTRVGTVRFEARAQGPEGTMPASPTNPTVAAVAGPPAMVSIAPPTTTTTSTTSRLSSGILYVMRSGHQNYKTRIPAVMETWGKEVNSTLDGLIIIGDQSWPGHRPPIIRAEICGNDHSKQLCCKTGYALMMAAQHLDEFSWFFVVDDDMYVNLENSRKVLSGYDPSKLIALGIPGCGPGFCADKKGGFCGGGGYAVSRASLRKLMVPSPEDFHKDLMKKLAVEKSGQAWDDISISCSLKRHNIKLLQIKGLHGWRIEGRGRPLNSGYERAIRSRNPLPITFHYLTPDMMTAIHRRFQDLGKHRLLGSRILPRHAYDEQLQQYLLNMSNRHFFME